MNTSVSIKFQIRIRKHNPELSLIQIEVVKMQKANRMLNPYLIPKPPQNALELITIIIMEIYKIIDLFTMFF